MTATPSAFQVLCLVLFVLVFFAVLYCAHREIHHALDKMREGAGFTEVWPHWIIAVLGIGLAAWKAHLVLDTLRAVIDKA